MRKWLRPFLPLIWCFVFGNVFMQFFIPLFSAQSDSQHVPTRSPFCWFDCHRWPAVAEVCLRRRPAQARPLPVHIHTQCHKELDRVVANWYSWMFVRAYVCACMCGCVDVCGYETCVECAGVASAFVRVCRKIRTSLPILVSLRSSAVSPLLSSMPCRNCSTANKYRC